jgi:hypothetical protein
LIPALSAARLRWNALSIPVKFERQRPGMSS